MSGEAVKRALIVRHLQRAGIPPKDFADHVSGWDLKQPVFEMTLAPGERLLQFISNPSAAKPTPATGNYFGWAGAHETASLGIGSGLAGRTLSEFQVARPVMALAGTAARITATRAASSGYSLRGRGGADQLFLADRGLSSLVPGNADLRGY